VEGAIGEGAVTWLHSLQPDDARVVTELLSGSLASSTQRAYSAALQATVQFCVSVGEPWLPMAPSTFLRFLAFLRRQGRVNGGALRTFSAAVRKAHEWAAQPSPTDDTVVRAAIAGYQRVTEPLVVRFGRKPITLPHVQEVVRAGLAAYKHDWELFQSCAAVVWQFVFFARASTLERQLLDSVSADYRTIVVKLSMEKGRLGEQRRLAFPCYAAPPHLADEPHPFLLLRRWIRARVKQGGDFLLRCDAGTREGAAAGCWQRALQAANVDAVLGKYTPHSARAGGASAASAAGVPDAQILVRGGWKSKDMLLSYVHPVERHRADVLYFGFLCPTVAPLC